MGDKKRLRIWQNYDMDEVKKHLIITEDLYADCANCRHLGMKYTEVEKCPNCGTEFKYIASRIINSGTKIDHQLLSRIQEVRPNWIVIDWPDYEYATKKNEVDKLFGGGD